MQYSGIVMLFIPSNKNIPGVETRQVGITSSNESFQADTDIGILLDNQVMYIPAVPLTPQNQSYVERQKIAFLSGETPPDFRKGKSESDFVGVATVNDIVGIVGRRAMGINEA